MLNVLVYIVECKCNRGPLQAVNRETHSVTLTLQLDPFIIYTRNDNATKFVHSCAICISTTFV